MPAISSNKPYRIGRSKTGLGLFATKPIKKGEKIIRYIGPLLDSKKKEDEAVDNKYLFEINNRWTIDGSPRKNIARYINHSCRPNSESDVSARKKRVVIRAVKNIGAGEEINYDYGKDYFKIFLKPIGCKCDHCEKKRSKERAEAKAEKARLKLKAEKKADKAKTKANGKAVAPPVKAKKAAGAPAKAEAHARGAGKVTKTKASRTLPLKSVNAAKSKAERKAQQS